MTNPRSARELVKSTGTAATRLKAINDFNVPVLNVSIALCAVALVSSFSMTIATPKWEARYAVPDSAERWIKCAAAFLSFPAFLVFFSCQYESFILLSAAEAIEEGELEEAEALLQHSLLAQKEKR